MNELKKQYEQLEKLFKKVGELVEEVEDIDDEDLFSLKGEARDKYKEKHKEAKKEFEKNKDDILERVREVVEESDGTIVCVNCSGGTVVGNSLDVMKAICVAIDSICEDNKEYKKLFKKVLDEAVFKD